MSRTFLYIFFFIGISHALLSQSPLSVSVNTYTVDCKSASAAAHATGGQAPYHISWSQGAFTDSVMELPPGNYALTVTDSYVPSNTVTVNFTIQPTECKVSFGNHFTPNGDGINDTWGTPGHLLYYPDFSVQVYDRWGQLVHHQKNQFVPWDGTHLGINLPEATYYYIFFYKDGDSKRIEKGNVTIVR